MLGCRPHVLTALSAALSVTVLAGCNASSSGGGGDDADAESGPSLILITPEPVGVNPFLQLAVDGVEQAAEENGGEARIFESQDPTNIQQQMDAAVADAPDVLAVVGFEFADSVAAAATANPEQQFLFVDACTAEEFENVTCAVFREHEAVYLAGVEAGLLSQSGQVGAVVALDTPQIRRFSDPFGAGAQSVNAAVGFTPLYVGGSSPFNDPARAKEQALALVARGADHVMAAAAAGNLGVFDAAKEGAFKAFGVDVNQCPDAPGVVVDNVIKEVDVVTADSIGEILAGNGGGLVSYGLEEGGVTLTGLQDGVEDSGCLIADHPDVIAEVESVRDRIVAGEVTVDDPAEG
ncbi:BMP family ABC transporter substrate-binding protein [Blastococcus deserti]|uniref:BMP family ABC transporter substrate-binding protein n=1 Tax=Blastococcus deserti TaxID=2259033 RepID=A0ABW4X9L6_9ACTN